MKRAMVIGATSGLGKELTKILVAHDFRVGVAGRRKELLEKLRSEHPGLATKALDITNTKIVEEKLDELANELGGIDLLVISSGTGDLNEGLDFVIEKKAIETNVSGFTCVADWAFRYFTAQKHGHLVGITSLGGLRGNRTAPAYNATEAYQINYLEGLRQKATREKSDVIVTDIRPGFVDTDMAKGDRHFWVASVHKASEQIFDAISRKKKVAYVTKRWALIAAILKCMSRPIYDRM